jgi:hypothetical protein
VIVLAVESIEFTFAVTGYPATGVSNVGFVHVNPENPVSVEVTIHESP